MPRVDFGHYYKFLVSLGLILVGAAFVVPWLLLRESDTLVISRQRLAELTASAQGTIENKQRTLALFEGLAFVLPVLLVEGVFLIILGLRQWRERQKVLDQTEDAHLESEIRQLTPTELDDKLDRDTEEQNPPDSGAPPRPPGEPPPGPPRTPVTGPGTAESTGDGVEQRPKSSESANRERRKNHEVLRNRLLEVESLVAHKLQEALSWRHPPSEVKSPS